MVDARALRDQHAHRRVRARRHAGRRGDDHPRSLPVAALRLVTLYVAPGCHLCERALEVVHEVAREVAFDLDVVDISGNAELEESHRAWLPVLEVDGVRAFTYVVVPDALRDRLT